MQQDPELVEATASQPLTLQEEYSMQKSWSTDEDKCTFIILHSQPVGGAQHPDTSVAGTACGGVVMAGDVNLFFNDPDDPHAAEVEVMVAQRSCRRKGVAEEAVGLMMAFAVGKLGVRRFCARIGEANRPSRALFSKLGFLEVSRTPVFREVVFELLVAGEVEQRLLAAAGALQYSSYD